MKYKFTEIKGIKRIKKSFTCMNVCDIQYPRLDEDFVTTDTDQTISSKKTFYDKVTFSEADFKGRLTVNNYLDAAGVSAPTFNLTAGIEAPGPGTVSLLTVGHGIYNNTDDVFVHTSPGSLSITSVGDLTLGSSSNYKKIYIGSDVVPSSDSSQTLGGEDNQWSAVWANEVYCDEIYTYSARLPHARLSSGVINQLNATYEVPLGSIISVRLRVNSTFGIPSKDILIPIGTEFDIVTYASGTFPYSIFSYTEGENVVKMSLYILTIDTSSQSYVDKACTLTEGKYVAFNNIIFSSSTAETSTYDVIIQRVQ